MNTDPDFEGLAPSQVVLVFAKAPTPGRVKTRLAEGIGPEGAAEVYRILAERVWANLRAGAWSVGYDLWVAYDPPEAEEEMKAWLPGANRYLPQAHGDLGKRFRGVMAQALMANYARLALVGMDTPALSEDHFRIAFGACKEGRLVVGPTPDGGFYLMALSAPCPDPSRLFEGVPWSDPRTLAVIKFRAMSLGLRWHEMVMEDDVDTPEDLGRLKETALGQELFGAAG